MGYPERSPLIDRCTLLSERNFPEIISLIEKHPSGTALWLIPILEKWDRVAATAKQSWTFYCVRQQAQPHSLCILNQGDKYSILIGNGREDIAFFWNLLREKAEKIFTERGALETLREMYADFDTRCHSIRIKLIYRLDPGNLKVSPDGHMRKAIPEETPLLERWDLEFQEEEGTVVKRDIGKMIRKGTVFVYEQDNRIVSVTRIPFAGSKAVKLAGSYTPPELRRKGYGTMLQAAVCHYYLGKNISVLSDPEENNRASITVKEKLGFTKIGEEISLYPDWDRFPSPGAH
jgi:predicted GNAT family acetyltransferase